MYKTFFMKRNDSLKLNKFQFKIEVLNDDV